MPKTTKRAATKRAARIAKAHATQPERVEVREPQIRRRAPGYKPPARGVRRYPWATAFVVILLLVGVYVLFLSYVNHVGVFALAPPPKAKPFTVQLGPVAQSPCLKVVSHLTDTSAAPTKAQFNAITHTYSKAPAMSINTKKMYCVGINTNRGLIVLELDPQLAPNTVNNFVYLAQHHFYDGIVFHRVKPGFVIQTGDPQGNGSGGPGYKFNDEKIPTNLNYTAGMLAMANSGANTNGSQFFICTVDDSKALTKSYNLFGRVVQGMGVVLKIQGPDPDNASTSSIKPDVMNHVVVVAAP